MTFAGLLFSFEGRIGRGAFLALWLAAVAVELAAPFLMPGQIDDDPTPGMTAAYFNKIWPALFLGFLCAWIGLAAVVKRRHDFGRSGWPLLAVILAAAATLGLWWVCAVYRNIPLGALVGQILFGLVALYALWLHFECLLRGGDPGENFHGPPRAAPSTAQAESLQAPPPFALSAQKAGKRGFGRR